MNETLPMEGCSVMRRDQAPHAADGERRGCRRCTICGGEFHQVGSQRPRKVCYRAECELALEREWNRAKSRRRARELWGRPVPSSLCPRCCYAADRCRCRKDGR